MVRDKDRRGPTGDPLREPAAVSRLAFRCALPVANGIV